MSRPTHRMYRAVSSLPKGSADSLKAGPPSFTAETATGFASTSPTSLDALRHMARIGVPAVAAVRRVPDLPVEEGERLLGLSRSNRRRDLDTELPAEPPVKPLQIGVFTFGDDVVPVDRRGHRPALMDKDLSRALATKHAALRQAMSSRFSPKK